MCTLFENENMYWKICIVIIFKYEKAWIILWILRKKKQLITNVKLSFKSFTPVGVAYEECARTTAMQKWLFQNYWRLTKSLINWKHRTNLCGSFFGGTFPAGIIPKISFLHKHILVWFFRKAIVSRYKGRYLKPIYEILNYTLSFKNKVIYLHMMIKFIIWHQLVMNW